MTPQLMTRTLTAPLVVLLSALLLVPTESTAQSAPDSLILKGKDLLNAGANRGSVDSLKQARALFKQAAGGPKHRALAHYYAALADYRLVNQFPNDAEAKKEPVLNDAVGHLKSATDLAPKMADAWALLSGCYGQMMGLNPMRGMALGPKASDAMSKAKDLAPKNPRVWIIDGTSDYFTPGMFGGDKERALKKFKKAARLAERESVEDPLMPSWGHAEAYAWIGLAQMDAEKYDKARTALKNALDVNPDFGWVKYALLPKLEKQTE